MPDTTLRSRLIRLAAAHPELRADLLPLLKAQANPASADQNKPESYYGLAPRGVQAARRREDPNRVVFKVSRQVDTGEWAVRNMTSRETYALSGHGSDPQELAETLEASASASLRFQNMDTLDGPELNYVKAPRFPRHLAERIITLATAIVGAHYVALRGSSMGLEWQILPSAPRMTG
jgi:hypothetical protein